MHNSYLFWEYKQLSVTWPIIVSLALILKIYFHRWFFLTVGVDKGSRRVLIQTFLFALFFVLSRILTIPVYWYMFYVSAGTPDFYLLLANFKSVSFVWVLSSVVLDALNVYWLCKIIPKGLTTGVRLFGLLKRQKNEWLVPPAPLLIQWTSPVFRSFCYCVKFWFCGKAWLENVVF